MHEERLVLIGQSRQQHLVVVAHVERDDTFESLTLDLPTVTNGRAMKKASKPVKRGRVREDMRAEYDFSNGVRGKDAARFSEGTNLVLLAPDVAAEFPTTTAVNKALREVIRARSKRADRVTGRRG